MPTFHDDLIQAQRKTITFQKQRIEHLEAEKSQLRQRLTALEKLTGGPLIIIVSLLNFISFLLEPISELIVAC